jgi:hypothetical protein
MNAATARPGTRSSARIVTLDSLCEHLQWAIELEHFTLPPYLCALYSLDAVRNPEASEVVASVLVEEMLHMTLAANLLNAVGGHPRLDSPRMLPGYPRCLPHGDCSFEVPLLPFGPEALDVFLKIEQPAAPGGLPESDRYETIGQFYGAIRDGLCALCEDLGEPRVFCGDPARQIADAPFSGGGRIIAVKGLASALAALGEIVEQGEGAKHVEVWDGDYDDMHPDREQVGHYYRFQELKLGRRYRCGDTPQSGPSGHTISIDWNGVRAMRRNPRTCDHAPGSAIRRAQRQFNESYCALLRLLDTAFNGSPQTLTTAIGSMYRLKMQAQALMEMPTEDGLTTAGPTFEYVSQLSSDTTAN